MLARSCLAVLLVTGCLAFSQELSVTAQKDVGTDDDLPLVLPPPVSGRAFLTTFEGETNRNYLRGGVTVSGAYSSNIEASSPPISDMSYSIFPTIELDKYTDQLRLSLNYAPGFTFYQKTSALNQQNQNLGMKLQYRFTPNLTGYLTEGLQKTSNIFDQPNPTSATPVSGSIPLSGIAIITPVADYLNETTAAQLTYQVGENSMIGGGGNYSVLNYLNTTELSGLYDSRSTGGSLFYSTRFHEKFYAGVNFQYQNSLSFQTDVPSTQTNTETIFFFLTTYLKRNLSFSVSGGPQHYSSSQALSGTSASWEPLTMASLSWHGERNTVAASYARTVSGGGGLNGTFHSNNAGVSWAMRVNRNWTTALAAGYVNYRTLTPDFLFASPGGHSLLGTVSLTRTFNDHMSLQFGYSFANQSYAGIESVAANPNINRAFVNFNFNFTRPLPR